MIKRLGPYIADAEELTWTVFATKHPNYVLVIVPEEDDQLSPSDTHECLNDQIDVRPALNEAYRVGTMRRRLGDPGVERPLTIGRGSTNDIALADIGVSKIHAFFEKDDSGAWTVTDNDSTNGTFVNGCIVPPNTRVVVRSLDTLKFSRSVSAVLFSPGDFYHFLTASEAAHALDE